jgi:hypothetical protein
MFRRLCWRHSARQRIASKQSAGTDTATAAFQYKRTKAVFDVPPAVDACFRGERLRRDALSVPADDGLTEFESTRFAQ